MQSYLVKKADAPADIGAEWNDPLWRKADALRLEFVCRETEHQPRTEIRMLYDEKNIYGLFQVNDRYVRAVQEKDQDPVSTDSCVEFFVRPANEAKYFNFEMNCGGTMLLYHITHCRSGNYVPVPQEDLDTVERFHTLPKIVEPEIAKDITWRLGFRIPLSLFVKYFHIDPKLSGQVWHANFTKCGSKTSHPHWLSWMPLSKVDFHLPDEFGELIFE